ncbi:MAG: glucokinase [Parvularculaceae bacterium]|nr:glucokinase [Parvularculaceae bacterium]
MTGARSEGPVLVADIGGTNARFALATLAEGGVSVGAMHAFRAEDYESIRDAADAFLEAVEAKPRHACFAVAGPITDAVVEFTNSPWVLDIEKTRRQMKFDRLLAINDFEALATSVRQLAPADFLEIKPGEGDAHAPTLVIGPGTGLGQALIVPSPAGDRIIPTEGGHVAFAPYDDEEIDVLRFVRREHKRVSIERLLSGRGLVNIHRALCQMAGTPRVSLQADEITRAALTKEFPIAVKAVAMFCAILGAAAGDAVLSSGARGGVILGGGILPKIREALLTSAFRERFLDKGRMQEYVGAVPIKLITRDGAALVGAAAKLKASLDAH